MTAVCGGGTSAPKTGAAAVVDYSSGLLAAIFAAYDLTWLIPVIPLVGLAPLTLSTFCASDPPAIPTFTQAEVDALINLTLGSDFVSGAAKFKDLALNTIWYDACNCTSGSLTPFAPPAQPANSVTVVFPSSNLSVKPCGSFSYTDDTLFNNGIETYSWTWRVTDINGTHLVDKVFSCLDGQSKEAAIPIPVGAYALEYTAGWTPPGSTANRSGPLVIAGATAANLFMSMTRDISTNIHTATTRGDWYCNGQLPGATQSPCCPPDDATASTLAAILDLVTLIQRQQVPFAYVAGTSHTGLTGSGHLSVQGLLGAKVEPTVIPPQAGIDAGDPDTLWLDSWINWGNADGWTAREFLRASPHVSLPALAGQFTSLGYSLAPGLTVNITELVREA